MKETIKDNKLIVLNYQLVHKFDKFGRIIQGVARDFALLKSEIGEEYSVLGTHGIVELVLRDVIGLGTYGDNQIIFHMRFADGRWFTNGWAVELNCNGVVTRFKIHRWTKPEKLLAKIDKVIRRCKPLELPKSKHLFKITS